MNQFPTRCPFDEDPVCNHPWLHQSRGFIDLRAKEAERFNDLLTRHLPDEVILWDCREAGWVFEFEHLVLVIENLGFNPVQVRVTNWALPRTYVDPLRRNLRYILSGPVSSRRDMTGFAIILLRLAEEAVVFIQEWKSERKPTSLSQEPRPKVKRWNVREVQSLDPIFENQLGADLNTIDESGNDILGVSIKDICKEFPEEFRVLHVEPVFRDDLVYRFRQRQKEILSELLNLPYPKLRECVAEKKIPRGSALDRHNDLAAELCKPTVTFHGTLRRNLSSIVRWGFVKPGQKAGDQDIFVENGASYGYGIYSTPDFEYGLLYCSYGSFGLEKTRLEDVPGLRLVICAVLMGRPLQVTRQETWRKTAIADQEAHSHVSESELEYVVFDSAQIIPCYVVYIDFGAKKALEQLRQAPKDPNKFKKRWKTPKKLQPKFQFPADIEADKQAKQAAAAKYFPYGYGPAKGTSFVIEEIGEVSDDEEDYGDYQGQRKEIADEFRKWEEQTAEGGSWFDEYQKSRKTWEK